jgi:hypothetical protein
MFAKFGHLSRTEKWIFCFEGKHEQDRPWRELRQHYEGKAKILAR